MNYSNIDGRGRRQLAKPTAAALLEKRVDKVPKAHQPTPSRQPPRPAAQFQAG